MSRDKRRAGLGQAQGPFLPKLERGMGTFTWRASCEQRKQGGRGSAESVRGWDLGLEDSGEGLIWLRGAACGSQLERLGYQRR